MTRFDLISLSLTCLLATVTPVLAKMGMDGYGPDDLAEQEATATAVSSMTPARPTATPAWKEKDVLGTWWTDKKESQIEIYSKEDGLYYGKIVWVLPERAGRLDVKNHDPKKRSQLILGSDIFFHLKFDGKGKWDGGALYDPRNGNTYEGDLRLENHDLLIVEGFISLPIIGRVGEGKKFVRVPPSEMNLSETPSPSVTPGK